MKNVDQVTVGKQLQRVFEHVREQKYSNIWISVNFIEIQFIYIMLISAVQQRIQLYLNIFFFHILFHYGLAQDIKHNSLCSTVRACYLVYPHESQFASVNPKLPVLPPPFPFTLQVYSVSVGLLLGTLLGIFIGIIYFQIPHEGDI